MKNFNSFFNSLVAMPKRLAMVLTVLFTLGVGSMWGAEVTFTKVDFSSSDKTETKDPVTLTFDEVTINNQQIRFTSGKKMVVTSSAGKITRIDVSTNSTNAYISPLGNTLSSGTWTKESSTKYYWTGEAASITFTPNSEIRITEIKVSYSDASSGGGSGSGSGDIGDCNVTYDFTNINGFSSWGSGYTAHTVSYDDATVTFASANKQSQTIMDQPVTKGNEVSLVMKDGSTLSSVTWVCKQWDSKTQTITLHYSTNGGISYTSTGITSTNFTISSNSLPAGTNAVKITFSSSNNQVGISSCSIEKVCTTETTITLSPQGGTGGTTSVTATYGQPMPEITVPTLAGYDFQGYFTANGGSGTKYYNADGTSARDWDKEDATFTLIAYWKAKTYTVTLNNQGATTDGATSVTATYNAAMPSIASNLPKKTGYAFQGYFTATSDGTKYYKADGTSAKNWDKTSATTLYAQWQCVTPTITAQPQSATYIQDDVATDLSVVATAADATLSYQWQSSADNDSWSDLNGATTENYQPSTENVGTTYYRVIVTNVEGTCYVTSEVASIVVKPANCKWVETKIDDIESTDEVVITMTGINGVTYAIGNAKNTESAPAVVVIDNISGAYIMDVADGIKWVVSKEEDNLTFKSYSSDNYLYCINNNNGVRVGNTTSSRIFTVDNESGYLKHSVTSRYLGVYNNQDWRSYTDKANFSGQTLKFYKKECLPVGEYWINYELTDVVSTDSPIKNKIATSDANVVLNFQSVGEHNELPSTITIKNGAATLAVGTDYIWSNGALTILKPSQITDNITITIAAQKRKYTVTFDANGHGSAPTAQSITAEETASEPTAPEATGYTFGGWYKESACTNAFDFTTPITASITLYAKWTVNSYTVTWNPNGGNWGASTENKIDTYEYGATITKPADPTRNGYRFDGWGDVAGTMPANNLEYTAQWTKVYTVTWKGATSNGTQNVVNGDAVGTLPKDEACSDTYTTFVGWYTKSSGVETNPSAEPQGEKVTAETKPTKDVTYYAVWADGSGNTSTVDELTRETTGVSGTSYTSWSGKKASSSAVYAGQTSGGPDNNTPCIQLRSSTSNGINSGIVTTTSGGKATKIVVTWKSNTTNGRTLNIYGKNTAYSSSSDLYDANNQGTLIGTIVYGTSTELTISDDYEYIGLRSKDGAMYLDDISISWSSGVDPTGYISSCCQSQAVVTVAPTETELALNIDGTASTNVHISQEGAGNGKYNQPVISPAEGASLNWTGNYKQAPYDLTFTATKAGTYTITADFTETVAACPRYGTATINVVANPILVVSEPTISSQCGTASVPVAVTIDSRYLTGSSLTAQVTTTEGNGQFEICKTENGTFATTNLTGIAAGQDEKASETIYVRYVADVDNITPAVGTLTISDGTTTKTVTLNTTPTCGTSIRMTASDANSIRVITANGQWTRTQTPIQLRGAYLLQNLEAGQGAKVVLTSSNSNFKFVKPDVQSAGTATFESEKITTEIWEQNIHLVYTPTTYNANETTTITAKVITFGGNTEHASSTMKAYGRSFPETFVLALNTGDGWVALPADMTAPYGTSCNTGVGTHDPYPITVDDEANPTAATLAPARAVYKGTARNTPNTNPWTIQLESNELTGYFLRGSSGNATTIYNSDVKESESVKWTFSTNDNITYQLSQTTVTEGQKLGYNGTNKVMGQYKSAAVTYIYDFRILPIDGTICTYFVKPVLTLVSFDDNNITYTTPYDGTLNYRISADGGNTWTELTGVLDCKTLSFTLPVATYRGKTIVVKPNAAEEDCITVSDPIVIPNPSIDRGETPWRYTGVVGKPFSDNSKSITINDLQNALNVEIIQQVTNSNISASITPEGVVTVSMDAADATEGEHKAVLEFTSAGAITQQVGVVITIKSLALQEFDGGNEYLFTESTPIVLCHNEMISLGEPPTVYLSYPLYMNGSLITELGQFNQTSLTLTDLTTGTSMAAVSREMNGNGVVKLTFGNSITDDLIVGHMYRLSWENTNQVMTDQIGLPYTDCVMDFVFSENCDAPTALQACPVTNSGFTANWAPVQDCDGNVTVEVYTKGEVATLLDKSSFSTTEVKALSASFTNENWVTNKNNTTTGGPTISNNRLLISDVSTPTYYNLFSPQLSNFGSFDESTTYTITITLYQATNDAGAGAYFYVMDNGSDLKKSTIPTITDKTVLIDEQSVTSKKLTYGTTTFTVKGLSSDDRIRLLGFESSGIASNNKNVYISSIKIEGPGAGDVVATKNVSCVAGSVEITSLDANTQYYYTVSDGANTSREIAVKTYNNDPQVKFYDDENKTKELVETVVVDGKTTTVYVAGQNISGCDADDVVAYVSSGYRVNSSALVYDPKTATISGSIELTLTDPTITSGTLTIRDGVSQTYSLPIVSGSNIDLQVVEWKAGSAVVMYNGDPAQTASVTINGSPAGSTQVKAAEKDVAVYELPVTGLSTSANKHLVITIGANKAILTIPQVVTGTTSVISPNSDLVIVKDGIFQVSGDLTLNNVTIYGGGTLLVPNGQTVNVNTLTMRVGAVENGDYKNLYPQLQLKGTLNNTSGRINLDYLTTNEFYYPLSVPYPVTIADIQYPVEIYGANVKSDNTGSFQFKYYDGAERAAGRTGWIVLDETTNSTLNPNTGYAIWGIPKKVKVNGGTSTRQKFGIHRLPLVQTAANMMTSETSSHLTTVNVYNGSKRDSDNGWNYLGNPYLSHYGDFTTADKVMKLGKLVWDEAQGAWLPTDTEQRYVVFTNDCQNYTAELASTTIPAFSAFFIQADQGGAINFTSPNVAAAQSLAARRSEEKTKEITTGIILSGEKHSDRTGLLIADLFTEAYEFNADLSKFDNQDMNLYTISSSGNLAFMAINEDLAKQTIPLGYSVSTDGMYTIAFDEQRYSRNDIYALYLIDYDRNETTNLLHMDYNFYSETGAHAERFALQVAFAPKTATDVEYTQVGDVLVSREGNTLRLDNLPSDVTVTVYDAVGHLIEQHSSSQHLQVDLPTGYYLLHVANKQNSVVIDTFIP